MEESVSSVDTAKPSGEAEVLVLHTADAREWATYLQQIVKSSRKCRQISTLLYELSPADRLHGYNYECFMGCGCILLLVTGELLDMLCDPELQGSLDRLVSPPHRVVALLCGVTEEDAVTESFKDWESWRKISAEDEPHVYVSTILETITDSRQAQAKHESENAAEPCNRTENPTAVEKEEVSSGEPIEATLEDEDQVSVGNAADEETSTSTHLSCLTVQPSRVLCGTSEKLFIIFSHKVDNHTSLEVEFSAENGSTQRVMGTLENEYTLSVSAPDMPAGVVSLTMRSDQSSVSLQPVTYYTHMGEISHFLENATDPVNFMCQAFNLTSNATDSLDSMLTKSLKSRLPATSFQLFGVSQIEEDNMATYQRNEELPTLLHFAAKYDLKKLTAVLQECPGALQAYSVMNKHGDYPNKLAKKSGFSDLRQLMDKFVDTAAMIMPKVEAEEPISMDEKADVYEMMSGAPQDVAMISEDIYESMFVIDPECVEDLYEVMNSVDENPEEAMLRKFFQAKHLEPVKQDTVDLKSNTSQNDVDNPEEEVKEEDPYNLTLEDIYDTVDDCCAFSPIIQNRPPAPLPRPQPGSERETPMIFRVFSDKNLANGGTTPGMACAAADCVEEPPSPVYDPYGGMKTPGQRQLISLQERVKVGEITVDEAVNEFKAWKFDQDGRASSIRYQQENLKRLRESITRRHKERQKAGKELEYEISAPLQRNLFWGSTMTVECAVYESAPQGMTVPPAPPALVPQRSTWKTGSTSSTSSSGSNRLSTHSTVSCSSGTEPDFEDMSESVQPPPRPPRISDAGSNITPPMLPPRVPERAPEKMLNERYIPCPTRTVPQRPSQRHSDLAPPVPRRLR